MLSLPFLQRWLVLLGWVGGDLEFILGLELNMGVWAGVVCGLAWVLTKRIIKL